MEIFWAPSRYRLRPLTLLLATCALVGLTRAQVGQGPGGGFGGNIGGGINQGSFGGGGFDQNIQPAGAGSLYTGTGTNTFYGGKN